MLRFARGVLPRVGAPLRRGAHEAVRMPSVMARTAAPWRSLSTAEPPGPKPEPSRLRVLFEQYGLVFITTYAGVYVTTLGSIYELVSHDFVSASNAIEALRTLGVDRFVDLGAIDPRVGNFGVAWVITKFTEPLRFVLTAAVTPRIARLVGRAPPKVPKAPKAPKPPPPPPASAPGAKATTEGAEQKV